MWRWLQNAQYSFSLLKLKKRHFFLLQLTLLVILLHLLVGFFCALLSRSNQSYQRFEVSSNKHSAIIVLSPLQKRVENKDNANKKTENKTVQQSKIIDLDVYQKLKVQQTVKEKKESVIKKVQQPIVKSSLSSKKQAASIQQENRLDHKSQAIKPELKMITVETTSLSSAEEKKDSAVEKKSEKKVDMLVEDQKVAAEEPKQEAAKKDLPNQPLNDVEFVGYQELDSMLIENKVTQAVQKHFKPPVGMSKDIVCELTVQIDRQGKVAKVAICKGSGVLAYDSSARAAIYKASFPREVFGKTIIVILGQ